MASIITRLLGVFAKGSPLTNSELDNNFINLNSAVIGSDYANWIANSRFDPNGALNTGSSGIGTVAYVPYTDASVPTGAPAINIGVSTKITTSLLVSVFPLQNGQTRIVCLPGEKFDVSIKMAMTGGVASGGRLVCVEYDAQAGGSSVTNTRVTSVGPVTDTGWADFNVTFTAGPTTRSFTIGVWNESGNPAGAKVFFAEPVIHRRGANVAFLGNIGWGPGNTTGVLIPTGTDLNDMTDPGAYGQNLSANATLVLNYPVARAGSLIVTRAAYNMTGQFYLDYQTGDQWARSYYNGTWSIWKKTASENGWLVSTNNNSDATVVPTSSDSGTVVPSFRMAGSAAAKENTVALQGYSLTTANFGSTFLGTRSYGAVGVHTQVPSGRSVCTLMGAASDGTTYQRLGRIDIYTEEATTSSSSAGSVRILTTRVGAILPALSATFNTTGGLDVVGSGSYGGGLTVGAGLTLTGKLAITGAVEEVAVSVASAATVDIGAVASSVVAISGTTAITSLGTIATVGVRKQVRFTGILTLTHNTSTLKLPGGLNIVTAADDFADFRSTATGWICTGYFSGTSMPVRVADINNTLSSTAVDKPLSAAQGKALYDQIIAGLGGVSSVPPGMLSMFAMIWAPAGYLMADGSAISRTTYANLFNAITYAVTCNTTSGSNSITATSLNSGWFVGMPISGPGIPAGVTITAANGTTTFTISANATATATGITARVCPFGNGDGSTTFNVPDLRGRVIRGWDAGAGVDLNRILGSYQADGLGSHNHGVTDPGHFHSLGVTTGTAYTAGGVFSAIAGSTNTGSKATGISINNTGGAETLMKNVALVACIKY
jgi:microcystin-dependent protein